MHLRAGSGRPHAQWLTEADDDSASRSLEPSSLVAKTGSSGTMLLVAAHIGRIHTEY